MRTLRMLVATAPLLAAGACYDPFGPWGPTGTYYVESANGQGIPAALVTRVGSGAFTVWLTGGELRLRRDGSFRLELDYVESDDRAEVYYTQGLSGTWEREYDAVHLYYSDPETGHGRVVTAYRHYGELEVTLPGLAYGVSVRLILDR